MSVVALVAATLLGALPPVARRWGDRGLHLFIAGSAGIFLGTVFLHLLPELSASSGHGHDHGHDHGGSNESLPWFAALTGGLMLALHQRTTAVNLDPESGAMQGAVWILGAYLLATGLWLWHFVRRFRHPAA